MPQTRSQARTRVHQPNPLLTSTMATFSFKALTLWACSPLDLSDSGFSKQYAEEGKGLSDKFNLEPTKFERFKNTIMEKGERCCMNGIFTLDQNSQKLNLVTMFTRITETTIATAVATRWVTPLPSTATNTEKNLLQDQRIKANLLGTYLLQSLTDSAKRQLLNSKSLWKKEFDGMIVNDGPALFWSITRIVQPDNGHLVDKLKTRILDLSVKNFGFSVKTMLSKFTSLSDEIGDLRGTYNEDDKQLDFWRAVKTMPEQKFAMFVSQQHDIYRTTPKSTRETVTALISKMVAKQVNMEAENEWNKLSFEQSQILALTARLQDATKAVKPKSTHFETGSSNNQSDKEKKKFKYPEWKKIPPSEGEPSEKIVDSVTYYYCPHDHNGHGGVWGRHKLEDHKDKSPKQLRNDNKENSSPVTPSLAANIQSTKEDLEKATDTKKPKLIVDRERLLGARSNADATTSAFLAQFTSQQGKEKGGIYGLL